MSFRFSVGDIITISQLAHKLRKDYAGAPSQFKNVSDEIRSLSIILQDVDTILAEPEISAQQRDTLQKVMYNCHNILCDLETVRDKYSDLSSNQGSSHKILCKRAWKRLKWEPADVSQLRSRITLSVTLLNTFLEQVSGAATLAVKRGVDRLNQHQEDQEQLAILDWLSAIDYRSQQNVVVNRRQAGTCQWLLDSTEFKAWQSNTGQALLCWGDPGVGKTTLTSLVIDELVIQYKNDPDVAVSYIYLDYRQQDNQKVEYIFEGLLRQLVCCRLSIPENVRSLYGSHKRTGSRPNISEISQMVHLVAAMFTRIFIVIDALDEFPSDERRARLLDEVFKLQTKYSANIFCTSRPIWEITERFGNQSLEVRARDADVRSYLDSQMVRRLTAFVARDEGLQDQIKDEIVKATDGIFLFARLHVESLVAKRSAKALREALSRLRTGVDVYDQLYEDVMMRIKAQSADLAELAVDVLYWIVCTKRPLTTLELQHALEVEVGASELDESNLTDVEDMIAACCGLATVDADSHIISIMHHTAESYLNRTRSRWFPSGETDIATACLTYVSFLTFQSGPCEPYEALVERYRKHPFFSYAASNWGVHARGNEELTPLVTTLLKSNLASKSSAQALFTGLLPHAYSFMRNSTKNITGPHLAAFFGLDYIIRLLPTNEDLDSQDDRGRTPLSYAAEGGHIASVQILLDRRASLLVRDWHGYTPLHFAASTGQTTVVGMLLEKGGVGVNLGDWEKKVPLALAAMRGHADVVRLLISFRGADVDVKDENGMTPLSLALMFGQERVAELLLSINLVDLNSRCDHRWPAKPPLWEDSFIHYRSYSNWTPLLWAAEGGHDGIVKLLIETGRVLADAKDQLSRTALSLACQRGHVSIVERLLNTDGVDADSEGNDFDHTGRTPLSFASEHGHEEVVRRLLSTGNVNPDSKTTKGPYPGRTPLSFAIEGGHRAVAELLLRTGRVDINSKTTGGPIHYHIEDVIDMVLCFDPLCKLPWEGNITRGQTPLWWAVDARADVSFIRWVLENGADVDASPENGRTPLSLAAEDDDEAMVRLLLAHGAAVGAVDEAGHKPIDYARKNGMGRVVELLEQGRL